MKFILSLLLISFTLFAQPSSVTIVSPQDGATAITIPVNVVWNKSPLALAYTIQISTDNLFGSTVVNQSISDTTYSTSVIQTSTRYYWRVRAENIGGASAWTNAMFTTKLNIPSLLNPALGAIDVNLKPTLSWGGVLSSAKYTVHLSLQSNYETIKQSVDIATTTIYLDSLSRATTYYWRVRAYINGDTTTYSSSNYFTTIPNIPTTPNLIYPPDTSINIPVNVVLRWSKVQNATSYKLQVSASPIFSTFLTNSSFTDTLFRPKPFFNSNTQYYWRVNSTNGAGTSIYSGIYRFKTGIDTNKSKLFFQNVNIGTVKAGSIKDTTITISNTGNDDLIIESFSNQLPQWKAVNAGLTSKIHAISFYDGINGLNIFVGTWGDGVFFSSNDGISWSPVNIGIPNAIVQSIAVSGKNIFIGTGGVCLSTNSGISWQVVNNGMTNQLVTALAFSNKNLFAVGSSGVFLSTNDGTIWAPVNSGLTNTDIRAFAISDTNLFAGTYNHGVFHSTNNGKNWSSVNNGLSNLYVQNLSIYGTSLFVGTNGDGVFRSTNNGSNWIAVNNGLTSLNINSLAFSGKNIFAGTWRGGIFLSTNNGTSWIPVNLGLTNTTVHSFAAYGMNIFAGTDSGVFRSTFVDLIPSISTTIISPGAFTNASIHLNSIPVGNMKGKIIVVSNAPSSPDTITVNANGILTDVKKIVEIPKEYALSQNYPNPFNPTTTIRYGIPFASRIKLAIYNILGQMVVELVNNEQPAGTYETIWNAKVSSGLYFYRIEAVSTKDPNNRFFQVKKMLLLK